jgi:hypothetical protein
MTKASILFILIFSSFLMIYGCRASSAAYGLNYQKAVLARMTSDGKLMPAEDGIFKKGEDVYLVLLNVGEFKSGKDGLNWFDIDAKVTDPDGKVILLKTSMLGEHGHIKLENNAAKSPHVYMKTSSVLASGKYKIHMKVYDKIGKGSVSVSKTFVLQ